MARRRIHDKRFRFSVAENEIDDMRRAQAGRCALCKRVMVRRVDGPEQGNLECLDHCHTTGRVRGLLCTRCNLTLGAFNDDPTLFSLAIRYLTEH